MRILMVPSWYPVDETDWHGCFFREQAAALRAAGHEIVVLVPEYRRGMPRVVQQDAYTLRVQIPAVPKLALPNIRNLSSYCLKALNNSKFSSVNFDLVHAHSVWPAGLVAQNLAQNFNLPLVITEHRMSTLDRFARGNDGLARAVKAMVRNTTIFSAVSTPFATALAKGYGLPQKHVQVLPNLLNESFVTHPLPSIEALTGNDAANSAFNWAHVSHLDEVKRVEASISALHNAGAFDAGSFLIAGGSANRIAEVDAYARSLGIETKHLSPYNQVPDNFRGVVFYGACDRDQVRWVLDQAETFLLASSTESFGVVFIEALARGLDLLGTRTWGGREIITPSRGTCVPIDDAQELTDALSRRLQAGLKSRAERERLSQEAVTSFGADAFVERTVKLWRSAMAVYDNCAASGGELAESGLGKCVAVTTWFPTKEHPAVGAFVAEDVQTLRHELQLAVLHFDPQGKQRSTEMFNGVKVHHIPLRWRNLGSVLEAARIIRVAARQADYLHTMAFPAALLASLNLRLGRKRRFTWIHTEHLSALSQIAGRCEQGEESTKDRLLARLAGKVLQRPDRIVAVSELLAKRLQILAPAARVSVIGNLVAEAEPEALEARFKRSVTSNSINVLGIGGLIPGKDPLLVLETLGELRRRGWRVKLTWLGEGELRAQVVKRAKQLHVNLDLPGQVKKDQVSSYLAKTDVFFVPTHGETFFLGGAEALAHGVPVLTSNVGAQTEYLPEVGARALPLTAEVSEWADALEQLITEDEKSSPCQLVQAVARFSRPELRKQYRDLYLDTRHA